MLTITFFYDKKGVSIIMKKIAIIGANSFIARNLEYILKKRNEEIYMELYDYTDIQVDGNKNYKKIDIIDSESVKKIDFNCDIIFMFVGKTGSANGFDDFNSFIDLNERSLLTILNEYRRQNSKAKIIFPSTRLVYKGKNGLISEDDEKEFKTVYATNKYSCEQYLQQYNRIYNVQYCIFRICIPYGTLIPNASSYGTAEFMLTKAKKGENITIYGSGNNRRTITYIGDLCEIMIESSLSENCINDIFNIGGEDYSLKEMATLIAKEYSVEVDYVDWPDIMLKIETGNTVFSDKKLRNICNIKYKTKFDSWCKFK